MIPNLVWEDDVWEADTWDDVWLTEPFVPPLPPEPVAGIPFPPGKPRRRKPLGFEILKPGEHYDPHAEKPKPRKVLKAPPKAAARYEAMQINIDEFLDNPPGTIVVVPKRPDLALRRRRALMLLLGGE